MIVMTTAGENPRQYDIARGDRHMPMAFWGDSYRARIDTGALQYQRNLNEAPTGRAPQT